MVGEKARFLARLYGFALGDGSIAPRKERGKRIRYVLVLYGTKSTLTHIQFDLLNIMGYSSQLYCKEKPTECWLQVTSRILPKYFIALGFPVGRKINQKYVVPRIFRKNSELMIEFLRGLFGADGNAPIVRRYTPLPIHLTIIKSQSQRENVYRFLGEIAEFLRTLGINTSTYEFRALPGRVGVRLVIENDRNVYLFLKHIGYAYDVEKITKAKLVLEYLEEKLRIRKRREEAIQKALELRKRGYSARRIFEKLKKEFPEISFRMIERAVYGQNSTKKSRIWRNLLPPFEEWVKGKV